MSEDGYGWENIVRDRLGDGVVIARTYFQPGVIDSDGVIVRITRIPADGWDDSAATEPDLIVQERITAERRRETATC